MRHQTPFGRARRLFSRRLFGDALYGSGGLAWGPGLVGLRGEGCEEGGSAQRNPPNGAAGEHHQGVGLLLLLLLLSLLLSLLLLSLLLCLVLRL